MTKQTISYPPPAICGRLIPRITRAAGRSTICDSFRPKRGRADLFRKIRAICASEERAYRYARSGDKWIPASARMTACEMSRESYDVTPAEAGVHARLVAARKISDGPVRAKVRWGAYGAVSRSVRDLVIAAGRRARANGWLWLLVE